MFDSFWLHGLQHASLPVLHHLLEFAKTHVDWVGDAIKPSCPLLSPSPSAFNLSQHWGLFQWITSLHQVAKVLELQLQHQSFQWIFRFDFLWDWLVWSPCCPKDSQASSPAPQFESINSSALSTIIGKTISLIIRTFLGKLLSLIFNTLCKFANYSNYN